MSNKLKGFICRHWIFLCMTLIAFGFQCVYLEKSTVDVPLMDYWKYINMFVEKTFLGEVTLGDIWQNDGIHRSPLQFIYFILNTKLFGLNARVEIFAGALLMIGIATVLYVEIIKNMPGALKTKGICCVAILILVFNLNQYELLNEQFALSFASRMLFFHLSFIFTSQYLSDVHRNRKWTALLAILYFVTILMVASGYFPAYVVTIAFSILMHFAVSFKENRFLFIREYLILLISLILGTLLYMDDMGGEVSKAVVTHYSLVELMKNYILSMVTMVGVAVIGFQWSTMLTLLVGFVLVIVIVILFVEYIMSKKYIRSYLPILYLGYAAGAMTIIFAGRIGRFDLGFAYSPRYVCETNLCMMGGVWMALYLITDLIEKGEIKKRTKAIGVMCVMWVALVLGGIIHSDRIEWGISPYRKAYGENLIDLIFNVDTLVTEDFSVFQAEEQQVRRGIEIMEKYNLGLFREDKLMAIEEIGF